MATFGPIVSPNPNVLYDAARVGQAVQGYQRNALAMDAAREDQGFQRDNQRAAVFERDRGLAAQLAGSVLALPQEQRQAAYAQGLAGYQREGRLPHAPPAYPGDEHMQRIYMSGLSVPQMEARRTQEVDRAGLAGMFGGAPAAPSGAAPAGGSTAGRGDVMPAAPAGGGLSPTLALQRQAESGGNPNARNPRSSATGADQFIDSTWLEYAAANPQQFQGMSREQILARRTDEGESGRASQWYQRENSRGLAAAGLPNGPGETTLAHRFGLGGASSLLRSDPNQPIAQVVGADVMRANPDLAGKTVGQVRGQYQQRYGGTQQAAAGPQPTSPGGVAARTGGTDMAGPGAGPPPASASGIALNPPGTPSWAQGTTAVDQVRLRALSGSRGMTQEKLIDEASKMAQANRQQQRWEQSHPVASGDAGPFGGTGMDAQVGNLMLRIGPKIQDGTASPAERQQYALAHGHMTRGTTQLVDDGRGGQVLARIPGQVPEGFPAPNFQAGAPGGAPAAGPAAPAAEPSAAPAAPAAPPGAAVPIPGTTRAGGPSATDRTKLAGIETDAKAILDALNTFGTARANAGLGERAASVAGQPTELNTTYNTTALLAKGEALFNLGVLNGPDLDILRRVLADPSTLSGAWASNATVQAQIKRLTETLNGKVASARQQYGGGAAAPRSLMDDATPPPPPGGGSRPPLSSFGR